MGQSGKLTYICSVKTKLRHTFTVLLTLSILLSSFGAAFSEQLCLMSGMRKAEVLKQEAGCCEEPSSQSEAEDGCCTVKVSFEKLEPVSNLKAFALEAPALLAVLLRPLVFPALSAVATDRRILTYTDSSPPLYGRSLLHRIHILIV